MSLVLIGWLNFTFASESSNKYFIKKIDPQSKRAVIFIGKNSIEMGDVLELLSDGKEKRCKLKVLKIIKDRALVSTDKCLFKISMTNKVVGVDLDTQLLQMNIQDPSFTSKNTSISQDGRKIMRRGRYITGGILGSSIGFGLGHAIQGRWGKAVLFHVTPIVAYNLLVNDTTITSNIWLTLFITSIIVEKIDVWFPNHRKYKIADRKKEPKEHLFFIAPIMDRGHTGLSLGMSF